MRLFLQLHWFGILVAHWCTTGGREAQYRVWQFHPVAHRNLGAKNECALHNILSLYLVNARPYKPPWNQTNILNWCSSFLLHFFGFDIIGRSILTSICNPQQLYSHLKASPAVSGGMIARCHGTIMHAWSAGKILCTRLLQNIHRNLCAYIHTKLVGYV